MKIKKKKKSCKVDFRPNLKADPMISEAYNDKIDSALKSKSDNSNIPLDTIQEVYIRGLENYEASPKRGVTREQWAFSRVNSFLAGGKAFYEDEDLWEVVIAGLDEGVFHIQIHRNNYNKLLCQARCKTEGEAKALIKKWKGFHFAHGTTATVKHGGTGEVQHIKHDEELAKFAPPEVKKESVNEARTDFAPKSAVNIDKLRRVKRGTTGRHNGSLVNLLTVGGIARSVYTAYRDGKDKAGKNGEVIQGKNPFTSIRDKVRAAMDFRKQKEMELVKDHTFKHAGAASDKHIDSLVKKHVGKDEEHADIKHAAYSHVIKTSLDSGHLNLTRVLHQDKGYINTKALELARAAHGDTKHEHKGIVDGAHQHFKNILSNMDYGKFERFHNPETARTYADKGEIPMTKRTPAPLSGLGAKSAEEYKKGTNKFGDERTDAEKAASAAQKAKWRQDVHDRWEKEGGPGWEEYAKKTGYYEKKAREEAKARGETDPIAGGHAGGTGPGKTGPQGFHGHEFNFKPTSMAGKATASTGHSNAGFSTGFNYSHTTVKKKKEANPNAVDPRNLPDKAPVEKGVKPFKPIADKDLKLSKPEVQKVAKAKVEVPDASAFAKKTTKNTKAATLFKKPLSKSSGEVTKIKAGGSTSSSDKNASDLFKLPKKPEVKFDKIPKIKVAKPKMATQKPPKPAPEPKPAKVAKEKVAKAPKATETPNIQQHSPTPVQHHSAPVEAPKKTAAPKVQKVAAPKPANSNDNAPKAANKNPKRKPKKITGVPNFKKSKPFGDHTPDFLGPVKESVFNFKPNPKTPNE